MVEAGVAPWSEGFRRATKRSMKNQNVQWSLSSGYRQSIDLWDERPKKPKTKQVKLYNGRVVEVPDADYEDFIGHKRLPQSEADSEIGQYIDKGFSDLKKIQDFDGVGHIYYVEYVPTYQLLRVEFSNDGAVYVFFRVPKEVYSELKHLAESGATAISPVDGKQRHVLGMRFWDIIRIRGQRNSSRYRYENVMPGTRTGTVFEKEVKESKTEQEERSRKKIYESDESLYDGFAKNMLTGKYKDEYDKLTSVTEKKNFLHSRGII